MTQIRVCVVDDHEVVRRGIRDLVGAAGDMTLVGQASTESEAVEVVERTQPDVVLLDVRLGDGEESGIEVCREILARRPGTACLMLTSFSDDEALFASIMAGASGYVLKQIKGAELLAAIRKVAAGESTLDSKVTARVLQRIRSPEPAAHDPLAGCTPQERRILAMIAEGKTNREIGEALFLAEKTVKNYVSTVLGKLGFHRRAEAAAYAARLAERRRPSEA